MAIAPRRVVVVWNEWWVLGVRVVYVGIYGVAIALNLPVAWHGYCCPCAIVVCGDLKALGCLGRGGCPVEMPLATYVHNPLGITTLKCLISCGVG